MLLKTPQKTPPHTLMQLPEGKAWTLATLKVMRQIVRAAKKRPAIRFQAIQLTQNLPNKNYYLEAQALHDFVRDDIRYIRDVRDVETIAYPEITLKTGAGDCDDKVVLLASLLESIGHPTRFVAIGRAPQHFEHVYLETKIGERWVASETTEPWPFGRRPKLGFSMVIYN